MPRSHTAHPAKSQIAPCSASRESPFQACEIWEFLAGRRLAPPCILAKSPCISQIAGRDGFAADCILSQDLSR
jgi:hypothetical protein